MSSGLNEKGIKDLLTGLSECRKSLVQQRDRAEQRNLENQLEVESISKGISGVDAAMEILRAEKATMEAGQ